MDETRGITVKVPEALHGRARQEAEANTQTMSQFIETVLQFYFNREESESMSTNKRTLAFQVSEEFYQEVQDFIKKNKMKLKDFGINAMVRMMESPPPRDPGTPVPSEQE
ncbi:hypothetical protein FACS1894191_5360 [Clostridia bacterium]|nr:hypothetical protein FACS1894191_5360 [Clostridia bacterium]